MKTHLFLWVFLWLLPGVSDAQHSRSGEKSSNVYRRSYQRMASVSSAASTCFEIRGGVLWAWGQNDYGQLGDGTTVDRNTPVQVGVDTKWVSVRSGRYHSIGIKSDGTLWAWGRNNYGQLGDGTATDRSTPVQVGMDTKWVSISNGTHYTIALKSDGTLWAWGRNDYGQLGDGTTVDKNTPVQVGVDTKWVSIASGRLHNIALKSDGTLWTWGWNIWGQLGNGSSGNVYINVPTQIGIDNQWTQIGSGNDHSLALKSDGTLWTWGRNDYGQLGDGTLTQRDNPIKIGMGNRWVSVVGGELHTVALKSDGTLWTWGYNYYGQLGDGTTISKDVPTQIGISNKWMSISAGRYYTLALQSNGTLWTWGSNNSGQLGDGTLANKSTPQRIRESNRDWLRVVQGQSHTIGLKSDGTLWAWGQNDQGQLGDGTNVSKSTPIQVGTDDNWISVAAGFRFSIALKSDGTLWTWGRNNKGQLGDGTTTNKNIPTQIGADTKWVSIVGGQAHTVALKSDGTLWAWGDNSSNQLGDGSIQDTNVPIQIGTDTQWVSVSAGTFHTVALKSNGTLWTWGSNIYGQLGDGTTGSKNTPTQIGTGDTWVSISAGQFHTLAIKSNGTLWAWGHNSYGQLGDGTNYARSAPVQIGADTKWLSVNTAATYTIAHKSDGTLWAWGWNTNGQFGNGTNTNNYSPTQISSQVQVVSLGRGYSMSHSAILTSDRNSICMTGKNDFGQLGDGTTTNQNTYNCASNICRAYNALPSTPSTTCIQPLSGLGNRTDFQLGCTLLTSVTPSGGATAVSGNLTAWVFKQSSIPTYQGHAYVARHYDLRPDNNADAATATVTLYFSQSEFDDYNATNGTDPDLPTGPTDNTGIGNLRVSQFHGVPTGGYTPDKYPTAWGGAGPARVLLLPQSIVWNKDDSRWEVSIEITGFSGFFVHGNINNKPLPVLLSSFDAKLVGEKKVLASWIATNTQQDKEYILERSADGNSFLYIGSISPTAATDYRMHDYTPLMGKNYYRLRIIGIDGRITYSEIKSVMLDVSGNQAVVRVYPLPAKDHVIIENGDGKEISGIITDVQGRTLLQVTTQSGGSVNVTSLAGGLYLLRLNSGETFKLVKE